MTPDLDQTLSLKAQLKDQVTPMLRKIEQNTHTTSQALQQLVQAFEQAGSQTGTSTGAMANKVGDNLEQLQTKLKETGSGFREFGEEASQSSRKVGQALEDALYTGGASQRLDQLEQDLGKVNTVFTSMASRQRSVSGRARVLQAISRDNINKKVIPAFQELHSTLDKYPDTLQEINKLEEDRMKMLDDNGESIGRVEKRIKGISGAFNEIKFGIQDVAGLVTGSAMGVVGMEVQEQQRNVGRIAGVKAFAQVPGQLQGSLVQSRTTLENIQPLLEATKELHAVGNKDLPEYIARMVQLQKATGMAADEAVALKDQLTRIAGLKEPAYVEVMDQMAFLAQNTNADYGDLISLVQETTVRTLNLTEAQRKNFLQQQMVTGATLKNMGLQSDSIEQLTQTLLSSDEAGAQLMSFLRQFAGYTGTLDALTTNPQLLFEQLQTATAKATEPGAVFNQLGQTRAPQRALEGILGAVGLSPAFINQLAAGRMTTAEGTGGTPEQLMAQMQAEAKDTIDRTAGAIRTTTAERFEQSVSEMQRALIVPGTKLVQDFGYVVGKFNEFLDKGITAFENLDRKTEGRLTTIMSRLVLGQAAWTGARAVGKAAGALGLPVPKGLTAENPITGLGRQIGIFKEGGIAESALGVGGTALVIGALTKMGVLKSPGSAIDKFLQPLPQGAEGFPTAFSYMTPGIGAGVPAQGTQGIPSANSMWSTFTPMVGADQYQIEPTAELVRATNSLTTIADNMTKTFGGESLTPLQREKQLAEAMVQMLQEKGTNLESREARRAYEKVLEPLGVRPEAYEKAITDQQAKELHIGGMAKDAVMRTINPVGSAVNTVKDLAGLFTHDPDKLLQMDTKAATHKNAMNVFKAIMEKQGLSVTPATPEEVEGPSWFDKLTTKFSSEAKTQTGLVGSPDPNAPISEVAEVGKQQKSILEQMNTYLKTIADNTSSSPSNPTPTANLTPADIRGWDYYAEAELGR